MASRTPKKADLLQGTLDLLILKTLAPGKQHGFGIGRRIRQASENLLEVEEGSLYPALHRLERRGLVEAEWGLSESNRRAKYYRLTRSGRRQLEKETAAWHRLTDAVGRILGGAGA